MDRVSLLQDLRQDLVYAGHVLRRTPAVTLVVVCTLALGIGANTAIFNLVDAVLLRKLPVRTPDELIVMGDPSRTGGMSFSTFPRGDLYSYPTWRRLQSDRRVVSGLAASGRADRLHLVARGESGEGDRPRGRMVSGNFFEVLGVGAMLGRTFLAPEDDALGGAPVAVINHGYWQRRFGGDSSAVGSDVAINGARFTIVGITPPRFTGDVVGQDTDIWLPASMQAVLWPNRAVLEETQAYWLLLLGRLQPGVSLEQARAALGASARAILREQASGPGLGQLVASVELPVESASRGLSRVRSTYRGPLLIVMTGVALLLLIICTNVANILMARAAARAHEMSVRLALGAGRPRLVRQLLTESLLLAILGAAGGLVLANWGSRILLAMAADGGSPIPLETGVGLAALGFTGLLAFVAVVVFGLWPALRTSRVNVATTIRAGARALSGGGAGPRNPLGRLLIVAQVALSVVLLVVATLLVRSLQHIQALDTGLDRDHLIIANVDANARDFAGERLANLATALATDLRQVPGVRAVSFSLNGIFSGTESATNLGVAGFEARQAVDSTSYYDQVGPGFAATTGARLLRGRDFTEADRQGAPYVVMLNESFARFYFGEESPVGRSIRIGDSAYAEVVGVISTIRDRTLTGDAVRRFYIPYLQRPLGDPGILRLVVRTSGDPAASLAPLRRAIRSRDADLPVDDIDALSHLMRQSIREERLLARLATVFGAAAWLLAGIGLYGVMNYAVSRRSGEIGLRMALGAQRGGVVGLVFRDALMLVGVGIVVGVPLTLAASRVIQSQLHGVTATDPTAFGVAILVLGAGACVAALLPAMRASRVEPLVALRAE
jgi:predicted permease